MSAVPATTATSAAASASVGPAPWTCPFCSLLCDGFAIEAEGDRLALRGSDCPRALRGLSHFGTGASNAQPQIDGRPAPLDAAIESAAQILAASRQPLFGGLATDVIGARALYPLACATGAICDPAGGPSLLHNLRSLQDRGSFTTTLAEVRNRADLIVCVGSSPREAFPEIWRRCGVGEPLVAERDVVFLGTDTDPVLEGRPGIVQHAVPLEGDLFETLSTLAALVAERKLPVASPTLVALAERLRAARYVVFIWELAELPLHGALAAEALNHQLIGTLNRHTRAAALPLGGNDGMLAVNQTFTWLSGVPLRSRAGPLGLEHEPERFDAARLIEDGSVDALLWISSFGPEPAAPASGLPCVVLGHPESTVPDGAMFIPVATPGIGSTGHLFRTDGVVALPLEPLRVDPLPSLPQVLARLTARVAALKSGATA
ncbi:MAG: formylmethanofuran dehydrogenase [Methylibium sp.]|nr:formylmethanofuran dehydrogenase [Methylibium sp.]